MYEPRSRRERTPSKKIIPMDEATYIERYLTSWIPHTLTFLSRCVCFFVLQFFPKTHFREKLQAPRTVHAPHTPATCLPNARQPQRLQRSQSAPRVAGTVRPQNVASVSGPNLVLVDANGVPTPACDGSMVPGRKKKCFRCAKGHHACERVVDPEHLPSLASKRQESIYGTPAKTGPTDPLTRQHCRQGRHSTGSSNNTSSTFHLIDVGWRRLAALDATSASLHYFRVSSHAIP